MSRPISPPYLMTAASLAFRCPPGPDQPVVLGTDSQTLASLASLRREYGDIVRMQKPNGRLVYFVNDPLEVQHILVRRHRKYTKGPGFERVKLLLGNGLIVSDGDVWRRSRRMIQPAFGRQNVHQLLGVMVECCDRRASRWAKLVAAGADINITGETSEFALELILKSIFGTDYAARIVANGENPFAFLSQDSARDLRVVLKLRELRDLLFEIIASRRRARQDDGSDFLSMYIKTTDKDGVGFSDKELLDELMTLIIAGFETSANTLSWVWYLLSRHPDVETRLLEEAKRIVPNVSAVSYESLADMKFTQQVLEETLRLYPPVWLFTRRAIKDDQLTNYDVAPGTDIYLSPFILHRTEDYWPNADRFDPDRFALDNQLKKELPFFPFSLGPRRCLGEYFSFLEMKVHIGLLLPRFRMRSENPRNPKLEFGINLRTAEDIVLKPELRH